MKPTTGGRPFIAHLQRRRRLQRLGIAPGGTNGGPALPDGPDDLSFDVSTGFLSWTYGTNPVLWEMFTSTVSPSGPWMDYQGTAGNKRLFDANGAAVTPFWCYVVGTDGSGKPTTMPSNVVEIDGF